MKFLNIIRIIWKKIQKGESAWGKDYKYSTVSFYGSKVNDDHDIIQIYYENKNDKIVATSGMITDLKLNQCIPDFLCWGWYHRDAYDSFRPVQTFSQLQS